MVLADEGNTLGLVGIDWNFVILKLYVVSKVVINLLIQPANWAVRNSRVSYAYVWWASCQFYNTDLTVVTSCCVYDCTNRVKNGSVGTSKIL